METIQIALASDENYFPGLLVTSVSLAQHASRNVALVFNVLDGGLKAEDLAFLRRKLNEAHPRAELKVFSVDQARFAAFPEWNGTGKMTYARLLLAELLDAADFVLYCDVDFLWTADASELWALRDGDYAVQACADDWAPTKVREGAWYAEQDVCVDLAHYICAGMMLMNVKRFRAEHLSRQLMDFLKAHPNPPFVDQTAINAVVGDIGLLPRKWGRFSRSTHGWELPGAWAIHFAGTAPWKDGWWMQAITDAHILWYRYYAGLMGLSYRDAVGAFLSPRQYGTRRLTWIVATHAWLRVPFLLLLFACGRSRCIPEIKEMA